MNKENFKIKIENKDLQVEMKDWTPQTSGSCLLRYGDTEVLVTAVMSDEDNKELSFFPLTVNYEERYYAAGKIYGSRFMRREGRPTTGATLTARMIDRLIRPLFPKGLKREVQVIITCLSWDKENDPDIIGAIASSIALSVSNIPWAGPASTVRVGKVNNKWVLNPTYEQREESDFDLILAGAEKEGEVLINMIEFEGDEVSEQSILEAVDFAYPPLKKIIDFQNKIKKEIGEEKIQLPNPPETEIKKETEAFLKDKLEETIFGEDNYKVKKETAKLENELRDFLEQKYEEKSKINYAFSVLEKEKERIIQENILKKERRPDERGLDEIREISCETGVLARTHGSGFFSRGLTKILSILTLGTPGDYKILEGMEVVDKKRFLHHYNFPPFSVGEVQFLRAPGRREIGHGALAEKAVFPLVPDFEEFPYTIRVVSEALSSHGSTSMGSVCATSLALMDGGVPLKRPAAGIAMGLIKGEGGEYKILTDIQGPEDALGDMDLKVAGTEKGITAIQMDVKVIGIGKKILEEALEKAKKARLQILDKMKKVIDKPREQLSDLAPKIDTIKINPEKIGEVIGPKGAVINKITEDYDVEIDIEDSGLIFVAGEDKEGVEKALEKIEKITEEPEVGKVYDGEVKNITDYGAFVEILPGEEGLVHISKLVPYHLKDVREILKEGDIIPVKLTLIDEKGRLNLSAIEAGFRPKKLKEKGEKEKD